MVATIPGQAIRRSWNKIGAEAVIIVGKFFDHPQTALAGETILYFDGYP
jgi:hypothetical protein